MCLTTKFTSLLKLSEPVCSSSSRLLFLARWCADKTVVDCWGASVLNYAINLAKVILLPVIQACSRAQATAVVLSRTLLVVDASNCKLHPSTTMEAHESAWCELFLEDACGCLEVISSLVGFAPFFYNSIAWKEGGSIGISEALFLLLTNLVY